MVGGLVAAAGGVGFISGLFVAGGLWGAAQCCRQVLLSWWRPSPPRGARCSAATAMELSASPVARGASLQITTCAEDTAGPLPMIVTDLGSLGIPVAYTADGVALAIPAEAAAEGGTGTIFAPPEDIPAADEGSRDVADGGSGTMVLVSFLVLGADSLEAALSHLDDELVSPAELICFVPDSFIMPVVRRLFEAWERHVPSEVQMEGSVTPREEGGSEFEDARERPSRARARQLERSAQQVRGDVAAPPARPCSRGPSRQRKRRTSRRFDSSSASGPTRSGGG